LYKYSAFLEVPPSRKATVDRGGREKKFRPSPASSAHIRKPKSIYKEHLSVLGQRPSAVIYHKFERIDCKAQFMMGFCDAFMGIGECAFKIKAA